ncbi:MAG TPA: IS200/IS605 family transposase [Gemmata sp.]|nr:IS200/IS605 family transposase [Gemmata sp.]
MSRNFYSEIHLHITWHTKLSQPLLTPAIEPVAHHAIRQKIINWPGAFVHEINGTATHVHVVATIVPTIAISEFIGQLKGVSSPEVNQKYGRGRKLLEWQTGYGVVSFGTKDLEWVLEYVRNQKERHAQGKVIDRLERIADADDGSSRDTEKPPEGG